MMMKTANEVAMTVKLTPRKKLFVEVAAEIFGNGSTITKDNARVAAEKAGVPYPTWFKRCNVGYNQFKLPELDVPAFIADAVAPVTAEPESVMNLVASNMEKQNLVPAPFEGLFLGVTTLISKRLSSPACSILSSLLACLVTVRPYD